MKRCTKKGISSKFKKLASKNFLFFHLIGILSLLWIIVRSFPAPHRLNYPCQQYSLSLGLSYLAFLSGVWKIFKKKLKIYKNLLLRVSLIILVSVLMFGMYSLTRGDEDYKGNWIAVSKNPIGEPKGYNPGRVVWIWDQNATETNLTGYWWQRENNDQNVIEQMVTLGIQWLGGTDNLSDAWDRLFRYYNLAHGYGDVGYQSGEKIAIKVNLNNSSSYDEEDNQADANPYVIKAILRQLVNIVGVSQEDITVYDSSRRMPDWFYYRVYYENYPANPLVPEFPNINYIDAYGGAEGRTRRTESSVNIYFVDGTVRALPECVVQAKYIIDVPLVKRHGINVTLSGKNLFGSWCGNVSLIHDYFNSGNTMNNPSPMIDLLSHQQLGGKIFLFVGDGLYACRGDNRNITKFQMYPFNNDWMSSLFFSQDPIAIDSVMYDFLKAENTSYPPSEGAQNYLHQGAQPPLNTYDPENDGYYLSSSLGVHEHWDTNVDIFSPDRYSGVANNGIDYIPDPDSPPNSGTPTPSTPTPTPTNTFVPLTPTETPITPTEPPIVVPIYNSYSILILIMLLSIALILSRLQI